MVAGGFRIYKTSRADTEAGTIRAMYAPRGTYLNKSLKALVDEPNSKLHTKVYVAGGSESAWGKAGYLLGGTYRPRD